MDIIGCRDTDDLERKVNKLILIKSDTIDTIETSNIYSNKACAHHMFCFV